MRRIYRRRHGGGEQIYSALADPEKLKEKYGRVYGTDLCPGRSGEVDWQSMVIKYKVQEVFAFGDLFMNRIDNVLENIDSLAITGHVHPDGDCVGSCLALYNYVKLNYPKVAVDVFLEQPTDKLAFLAGFDEINSLYDTRRIYDVMVCLDSASLERIGAAKKYFERAYHTINIDHHISNTKFAEDNYVFPNSSSACEALCGFLDREKINRDIAIALYTGIVYDTGVFKYSSTGPETMRLAGWLMEFGIPTEYIIDESFYSKTYEENRIFGYAVLNSTLCFDGKFIYSYISAAKMKEYNVSSRELEGIVSQLRLTKGVEAAAFLYELEEGKYKLSLRSKRNVDVNAIAALFGGGGHTKAAGATMNGTLDECLAALLEQVEKIMQGAS